MKRIYEEYLRVPEEGKIKEKVFIMRIAVAIMCVVCCLSAMGFSAYAFFASSITSGSNTIVAATYGVEAAITTGAETVVTAKADNPLLYENVAVGTYTVSLKATGTAKNGYCKIEIVGSEKIVTLFTQQLPPETGMSFTFVINGEANITITPQWGTYSNRDVVVGDNSTQNIQLVTVVNTPVNAQPEQPADKVESGAENMDSSGTFPNNSPDDQDVDKTTSDSASDETSNGEIDDGSSETIQDEDVIE